MQSRDLPAAFGQEVLIDLTRPIEPAEQASLASLMRAHGLLVFPTTGLTADQQRAATACFGRIMCDPQGLPLENYVSNQRQSSAPDGELIFHYDYAYDRNPTEFISLYGEEIAPGATPTRFASSARALDLVPATLRAAIEKRHALHACFMDRAAPAAARAAAMDDAIPRGQPGWSSADWRIARPLIWQNRAGVPCLYACNTPSACWTWTSLTATRCWRSYSTRSTARTMSTSISGARAIWSSGTIGQSSTQDRRLPRPPARCDASRSARRI